MKTEYRITTDPEGQHWYEVDPSATIEIGDYYLTSGKTDTYSVHLCHNERLKTLANQYDECAKIISTSDKKINL